jgi:hypothetical protein
MKFVGSWVPHRSFATRVSQLKIWQFWVIGTERNVCRRTFNRYSAITEFAKLAAGEQLYRRCTHRKLQHFQTLLKVSPEKKITHFDMWPCCGKWAMCFGHCLYDVRCFVNLVTCCTYILLNFLWCSSFYVGIWTATKYGVATHALAHIGRDVMARHTNKLAEQTQNKSVFSTVKTSRQPNKTHKRKPSQHLQPTASQECAETYLTFRHHASYI